MTVTLQKPDYAATVAAPTSKSAAHRALIAAAFGDKRTSIVLRTSCEDIEATARCLRALGAVIEKTENGLDVTPICHQSIPQNAVLDCGESGSTLRFLLPVCAALGVNTDFIRRGRLSKRPLSPLTELLTEHGASIAEKDDVLLLRGRIESGDYRMAPGVSSQYVTGLLFALSLLDEPSTLSLTGKLESTPYIDMTLDTLSAFNAPPTVRENGTLFHISGYRAAPLTSMDIFVTEGDFSGAAFPLAMGAIGTHPVTVTGLDLNTKQGDRAILTLLTQFGADVTAKSDTVTVSPAPLCGITVDAGDIPDLVPVLAVIGAAAKGTTHIKNAARLRHKESDRLSAISAFLHTLGGDITETDDGLIIRGVRRLTGGTVDARHDHRIAMSAAVASLLTDNAVVIPDAECVSKSYPTFFEEAMPLTDKEQL